jgi:uncharacterized membrane protein
MNYLKFFNKILFYLNCLSYTIIALALIFFNTSCSGWSVMGYALDEAQEEVQIEDEEVYE